MKKQAVLSLSGGMDSSTVLLRLLADGYTVTALSFDYGQKHRVELERAKDLISYLKENLGNCIILDVQYVVILKRMLIKREVMRLLGTMQCSLNVIIVVNQVI